MFVYLAEQWRGALSRDAHPVVIASGTPCLTRSRLVKPEAVSLRRDTEIATPRDDSLGCVPAFTYGPGGGPAIGE
jgi:hypothetical protein